MLKNPRASFRPPTQNHLSLAITIIVSWLITITAFDKFLSHIAEEFRENFAYQNQAEIAASDIFRLSQKLNIVSQNSLISCLKAQRAGHVFYEKSPSCKSTTLSRQISIGGETEESIFLQVRFSYPKTTNYMILAILFLEAAFLGLVFQKWWQYRFRKNAIELAKQMAHDIRSPLTALSVLSERLSKQSPQEAQLLESASKQIHSLATGMLDFERKHKISHSTPAQISKPMPMEPTISSKELKEFCATLIQRKYLEFNDRQNIKLNLYWHLSENAKLNLNISAFEAIISNLINNSFEATESGFITFTVERSNDQIIFEIRDSGKGMSAEVMAKLGERGFSHDKPHGNGLAISHAKELIKSWGGKFTVHSQPRFGTTVKISLATF
ncbi:MAG: hypothetical protein A4S09_12910 [Proteobacteria bacterium SG_bin7]|nr:MAG: hypothetical protein A4S09_12910 [Proteobacteria bacterium SG_bin7]